MKVYDNVQNYFIHVVLIEGQPNESAEQDDPNDGSGVVLLNPQWLSDIMSEVVALNIFASPDSALDRDKLRLFDQKGIVAASLLKQVWKERLTQDDMSSSTQPLFTILKQYGLLYPLSEKLHNVLLPSRKRSEDPEMMFLVPFKLPVKEKPSFPDTECGNFTVDFMSYLPDEVYSHLVIRFLEILDSHEETKEKHIFLSHTFCKFMHVRMSDLCSDWLLEIDRHVHKLTVLFR